MGCWAPSAFWTSWWHDAQQQWGQRRGNRSRGGQFLHDAILRIDWSWRPPMSYNPHEALLLEPKHTTISQRDTQQSLSFNRRHDVSMPCCAWSLLVVGACRQYRASAATMTVLITYYLQRVCISTKLVTLLSLTLLLKIHILCYSSASRCKYLGYTAQAINNDSSIWPVPHHQFCVHHQFWATRIVPVCSCSCSVHAYPIT